MCFVTIAVAYNFYGIFSPLTAFIVLIALVLAEIAVALWYKRRELAAVGIGGSLLPLLSCRPVPMAALLRLRAMCSFLARRYLLCPSAVRRGMNCLSSDVFSAGL